MACLTKVHRHGDYLCPNPVESVSGDNGWRWCSWECAQICWDCALENPRHCRLRHRWHSSIVNVAGEGMTMDLFKARIIRGGSSTTCTCGVPHE